MIAQAFKRTVLLTTAILFTFIVVTTVMALPAEIKEVRISPSNTINIRTGPGTQYAVDASGQLMKGEKLFVLEEKNGWVRFRVTPKSVGWQGWVKKDLTRPYVLTSTDEQWLKRNQKHHIKGF